MLRRRISAARGGGYAVRLPAAERELLESLPEQLDDVLAALEDIGPADPGDKDAGDAQDRDRTAAGGLSSPEGGRTLGSLRRLFPRAYSTDDEAQRNYESITRSQLSSHHRRALSTLARTARATSIDSEELNEWLTAVNDLRLVLGTVLGVTEEEPPSLSGASSQMVVYAYLSQLEAELVEALEASLPEPLPGADDHAPEDPWGEPLGGLRWDGTPVPWDDA